MEKQTQPYIELPFNEGTLIVTGDEGVIQDLYAEQVAAQRQAVIEAPGRAMQAMAGYLGEIAGNVAYNVKREARLAMFDAIHQTNYREVRHNLIEQKRRERFEQSIGIVALKK